MIAAADAVRAARSLLGTPYDELDCINLIKKVIRVSPGGHARYTTAGTNSLWKSFGMSKKYRDLTWRQEGLAGAEAGMLAFKRKGSDVHHVGLVTECGTVIHASSASGCAVETPLTEGEGWMLLAIHRNIRPEGKAVSQNDRKETDASAITIIDSEGRTFVPMGDFRILVGSVD